MEYKVLNKANIYNPTSEDSEPIEERKIFGGNPPSDVNFKDIKYGWSKATFERMLECEWTPKRVSLVEDAKQYKELSDETRDSYNRSLAQIFSMDSFQSKNLSINIIEYVTDPMISHALTRQAFDESLHAFSYGWIIDSVCGDAADDIYLLSSTDQELKHKNDIIVDTYESLAEHVTEETFVYAMFANQALEAIYFNSAFLGFYSLSVNKLMPGTTNMIKYINRDENNHTALFRQMIRSTFKERPYLKNNRIIEHSREILDHACKLETEWGKKILLTNDRVGLNENNLEHYIKYLTNKVCVGTGIDILYPEAINNNMKWVKHYSRVNDVKAGFLEDESTDYSMGVVADSDYGFKFEDGRVIIKSVNEYCLYQDALGEYHVEDIRDERPAPDNYLLVERDTVLSNTGDDRLLIVSFVNKEESILTVSALTFNLEGFELLSSPIHTYEIPALDSYVTVTSPFKLDDRHLSVIGDAYCNYDIEYKFSPKRL